MTTELAEWADGVSRAIARFEANREAADRRVAATEVTTLSPGRTVKATFDGSIRLRALTIKPGTLRTTGSAELSAQVMAAYDDGVRAAHEAVDDLIRSTFQEGMTP